MTFSTSEYTKGQHSHLLPKLSSPHSHALNIDGGLIYECLDRFETNCSQSVVLKSFSDIKAEVQQLEVGQSPFTIGFSGHRSDPIYLPSSLLQFKNKLEESAVVGDIAVSCVDDCTTGVLYTGSKISKTFYYSKDTNTTVIESVKGVSASVTGGYRYSAIMRSISAAKRWYVRAFACNQVGCRAPALFLPLPVLLFVPSPYVVQDLALVRKADTSITVGWNDPISQGGSKLADFIIEYDTWPAIASHGRFFFQISQNIKIHSKC